MTRPPIPKLMELVFDTIYLITVVVLGIYYLTTGQEWTVRLWGIMALTLAGGDACHLVPRMSAVLTGDEQRFRAAMGIGKMLTSVTMTIFYLLLWTAGLGVFSQSMPTLTCAISLLAGIRIVLCLLPQNGWTKPIPSYRWGIYRNIPFVLEGAMVIWYFVQYAGMAFPSLQWMWLAISLSFVFYIPVVLYAHKNPKLGMLMLPKSCAYVWIICMGLSL